MEITGYITTAIIVLGMFIEIVPVKFSPLNWLGSRLHRDLNEKMDNLETHIDDIEIDAIRNRILSYDALIRKGEHLKQYQYKSIFCDIDKWVQFHKKYPELNGMIDVAIENIKEAYKREKFDE